MRWPPSIFVLVVVLVLMPLGAHPLGAGSIGDGAPASVASHPMRLISDPAPTTLSNRTSGIASWFGSPSTPGDRTGAAMAFDAAAGKLLLSGGWTGAYPQPDSAWWLNGTAWQPVTGNGSVAPPPTGWASATYDSALNSFLEFGGTAVPSGAVLNTTWSYTGGNWTELSGSAMPAINASSMAFDPLLSADLLYGGSFDINGHLFCNGSTYDFHSGSWKVLYSLGSPSNPPGADCAPLMAWDPSLGSMILIAQGATWELNNTGWQIVNGATFPTGFVPSGLAFDSASEELYAFAERLSGPVLVLQLQNGRWIRPAASGVGSAPILQGASLAYDPALRAVVWYGGEQGWSGSGVSDVTWLFNGSSGRWSQIGPPPESNAAVAFDSSANETVVFGGVTWQTPPGGNRTTVRSNQTWIYRNGIWLNDTNPGAATPPARSNAALVEDPAEGGLLMFGGISRNGTPLGDTWVYANGSWSQLTGFSGPPTARWGASLAFNNSGQYLLLFGGRNRTTSFGDTFEFADGRWSAVASSRAPSPRSDAGLAYDGTSPVGLVLFGGTNQSPVSSTPAYSDTWSFGAGGWVERFPTVSPPNRTAATLTPDPSLGGLILIGGVPMPTTVPDEPPLTAYNDTWVYANSSWSEIRPPNAPAPLFGAESTFDPVTGGLLLFGGINLADGATSSDMRWLGVPSALSGTIYAIPTVTDVGSNVTLAATASGSIGPYFVDWNFGDGTDTNGTVVTHSYRREGLFNATAWIEDGAGGAKSFRVPITVHAEPSIGAVLATPSPTEAGWPTRLSAQVVGGTPPYSVAWNFGDGYQGTGNPILHQFPGITSASVTVWVNDSVGRSVVGHTEVVVGAPLTVQALASPTVTDIGVATQFTATERGGLPPVNYSWNFDDGATAGGQFVAHTFQSPGSYAVALWGNDSAGVLSMSRVVITVVDLPVATLGFTPVHPHVGTLINMTARVAGGVAPYQVDWNFDDGTQAVDAGTTQYAYSSTGQYRVLATVIDSLGVRASGVLFVNVTTVSVPPPASVPSPTSPSPGPSTLEISLLAVGGAGAAALLIVWVLQRRRRIE